MQRRENQFRPSRFNLLEGDRSHGLVAPKSFTARLVCTDCNSGWMSTLESSVMILIGQHVEPVPTRSAVEFDHADTLLLSRWLMKTAIIMDAAFPKPQVKAITPRMIAFAKGDVILENSHCFTGVITNPDLNASLTKGFPTHNGAISSAYQTHSEGIRFALHLNCLGLMLIVCPEATISFTPSVSRVDGHVCMPFINGKSSSLPPIAITHIFPDFYSFRDSIEIVASKHTHI